MHTRVATKACRFICCNNLSLSINTCLYFKGGTLERQGEGVYSIDVHIDVLCDRMEALCTSVDAVMQATKHTKHGKKIFSIHIF